MRGRLWKRPQVCLCRRRTIGFAVQVVGLRLASSPDGSRMTASRPRPLFSRMMDAVFGARFSLDEMEAPERVAPPRALRRIFRVLNAVTVILVVVALLWSNGWLPFVASSISRGWLIAALALDLALRFGWEQVVRPCLRLANDRVDQP